MFTCGPGLFGGVLKDPYWSSVVSLCHYAGANGSTSIIDQVLGVSWTTNTGTSISTVQSKFGNSSLLVGTGGSSTTAALPSLGTQPFTFEAFIYTSTSTPPQVIHKVGSTAPNFIVSAGNVQFSDGSVWRVSSGVTVPLNSWVHVAASKNSGTLYLFIGGVLCYSGALTTNFSTGTLYAGADTLSNYIHGYLAESRVTFGVGRYTSTFTPPTSPFPNS